MTRVFLLLFSLCGFHHVAAQSIDTLFARIPRSVMPLLDNTAKLDLLDLYNNGLTAKAENTLGGQAELQKKSTRGLSLRTSDAGSWQMELLSAGHDTLICCIHSVKAGGLSSQVVLYQRNWHRSKHDVPYPAFEQFFVEKNPLSSVRSQIMRTTLRNMPVEAIWDEEGQALIYRLSLNSLCEEEKDDAEKCVRDVKYQWKNGNFSIMQ